MSQHQNSLRVSHAQMREKTTHLRDLLEAPASAIPWWKVLTTLKDLAKMRETHITALYECNLQLTDIHWTVTPIIQATVLSYRKSDEQLARARRTLLQQMCVPRNSTQSHEPRTDLLKSCKQLLAVAEFEKKNVFGLFEIIAASSDIPATRVQ